MKRRQARFGAVAAVMLLGVVFLGRGTDRAWSLDQTLAAMKKIETVHIKGTHICDGGRKDFDCWLHAPGEGSDVLRMRFECDSEIVVVQGDTVHEYLPAENTVTIMDGSTIKDLQYWYEGATISPWLTGRLFDTLKLVGRDWKQTVETDAETGKKLIVVTCNHPPSNGSATLVVDPETKLVLRGKVWRNLKCEGEPAYDVRTIVYGPEIPDERFEFEVPPGATVVGRVQFDRASQLHKDEKYAEAIPVYWHVYNAYPTLSIGEDALMMIAVCHNWLGQHREAVDALEKAVREFRNRSRWTEDRWFYLGHEYRQIGRKDKALEAFEKCLASGKGIKDPEKFPLKNARAAIAEIKGQ